MLEDPLLATRRILPWVVMTHIKDGGILLTENGLLSFPAEAGKGIVDLKRILGLLSTLDRRVHLSLEDHGGEFLIPIFNRAFLLKFPDLTVVELARLLSLAMESQELFEQGKLTAVERSAWPEVCEERVRNGLRSIRTMAG
jgi:sugar phosphate isomerase/epimerase